MVEPTLYLYIIVLQKRYKNKWKESPKVWFEELNIEIYVASSICANEVNKYRVPCGLSLEVWKANGWINKQDPSEWFQWYCRYSFGRRTNDDERQ